MNSQKLASRAGVLERPARAGVSELPARRTVTIAPSHDESAASATADTFPGAAGAAPEVAGRLALLNAFVLSDHGVEVRLSLPAQRLLAFLALHEHPATREYVAGTLWLDSTQERAAGSLRSALCTLRQAGCELVEAVGGRLRLAPSMIVDVREGVTWARRVLDHKADLDDLVARGAALQGDILPDWYDDWVGIERERFRELRIHALEALCTRLTSAERFAEAMDAALAAVHREPLRESAHRAVISVHLAEGNRAEALEEYRRFQDRIDHDLGLRPSAHMEDLLSQITAQ
jgi:DNA-binding SARP family transcriptional activator